MLGERVGLLTKHPEWTTPDDEMQLRKVWCVGWQVGWVVRFAGFPVEC
jgi:hypothetical protein